MELIRSIRIQDFPQDQIEIIIVSEGDSESAKSIGIQKATGTFCCMLCADNYFTDTTLFSKVIKHFIIADIDGVYERHYAYVKSDNSLNRYFSLIGCNDPVPFYLGKCDREPWIEGIYKRYGIPSYGCNGFFVRRKRFKDTDLDHYYPMDAHVDMINSKRSMQYHVLEQGTIWHRTTNGNLLEFLARRYRYAKLLYCDRNDRRWRMVDSKEDFKRLALFIFLSITIIQPMLISIKGFRETKDRAWFWHAPVCLSFTIMYGILTCRYFLLSFLRWVAQSLSKTVSNQLCNKHVRTMK